MTTIVVRRLLIFLIAIAPFLASTAQEAWTTEQRSVLAAVAKLSAATAPDGEGADAYGAVLSGDFSRWTVGSENLENKQSWVEGIRDWFDEGWRVSDRESDYLQIDIRGNNAFVRRLVEETYLGPDGSTSKSKAALAEVWVRSDTGWLLQYVNVHPIPIP